MRWRRANWRVRGLRLVAAEFAVEVRERERIPERRRTRCAVAATRAHTGRLFGPARVEHRVRAFRDAPLELLRLPHQFDHAPRTLLRAAAVPAPLALPVAQRTPGLLPDLQRTHDPLAIVRVDASRRRRVDLRELRVQLRRAFALVALLQRRPHGHIDVRALEQAVHERLVVEGRAADEQCALAPGRDVGERPFRDSEPLLHREGLARLDEIERVMAHSGELGRGRLGGADVHAAVHEHRVERDDLGAGPFRHFQRQRALPAGRLAEQHAQFRVEPHRGRSSHVGALGDIHPDTALAHAVTPLLLRSPTP